MRKRIFILTLFTFLFSQFVFSQTIDDLSINPVSPGDSDTVQIIATTTFPSSTCEIIDSSITVQNDSVIIDVEHNAGMMPTICNRTDTLTIGTLSPGSYNLSYNLYMPGASSPADTGSLSFSVQNNNQEYPAIDSLKILEDNPTNQDSIHLISSATFPNSDCNMTDFSSNINNDSISAFAYHTAGALPAFCNTVDTINLGVLKAGSYHLFYHLLDSATKDTFDIDTLNFTIQNISGVDNYSKSTQVKIYPNPANETITLNLKKLPSKEYTIALYSGTGKKIRNFTTHKNIVAINTSNLREGIYLVRLTDRNGNQQTHKVIITDSHNQ
ncbi:MAG: T9SS type A sorting domain-containing protein [Bacteroidales bacterium]|nr:T9SS type A sorting domain-containing protein [Bacteroidales bacterium]MCF8327874.1 T9SS type A sorting domain-containing protein [Bacteroidales bacterium]